MFRYVKNINSLLGSCLECSYQRLLTRQSHYYRKYTKFYVPMPAVGRISSRVWSLTKTKIIAGGLMFSFSGVVYCYSREFGRLFF